MSPEESLEQLVALLNDGVWSYLMITDVALRVSLEENGAIVGSVEAGRRTARQVRQDYPTKKPMEILQALNVKVNLTQENPHWGSRMQCAEYQQRPPKVTIYEIAMVELARIAEKTGTSEHADPEIMRDISLSHELYHHLERTHFTRISRQFRLVSSRIGPFTFYRQVHRLDEIAAHAFAQALLDLTFNPGILELLHLHCKEQSRAALLKEALAIRTRTAAIQGTNI